MQAHHNKSANYAENTGNGISLLDPVACAAFRNRLLQGFHQGFTGQIDGGSIALRPTALAGLFGFGPGTALAVGIGKFIALTSPDSLYIVAVNIFAVRNCAGLRMDREFFVAYINVIGCPVGSAIGKDKYQNQQENKQT
jgi:hypothetical protein